MDLDTAIAVLKQDLRDHPEKLELEKTTLEKFGKLFAYDNIDNISTEQFEDFCDIKNNHHWTISRHKTNLTQDMPKLKKSLKILLDESIPIANRLKRLRDPKDPDYQKFLGEAYFSPILLVTHPDKYPVYNETVKQALDKLHVAKLTKPDIWERYPEVQNIILNIAKQNNLSLWQIDWVWWKALGAYSYEELLNFIKNEMVMQENYQPIVIRKILYSGSATREEIEDELRKHNHDSKSISMINTVLQVLQDEQHPIIRKQDDEFVINSFDELSSKKTEELIKACDQRLEEFEGKIPVQSNESSKRLILFSVSGGAAYSHFEKTMKQDVLTKDLPRTQLSKYERLRLWGSIPTKQSIGKWQRLKKGDILLFYKDKEYVTGAVLEGTFQHKNTAQQLWGSKNVEGFPTWELMMYTLSENLHEAHVDFQKLNKLLGYQENFMPTRTLDFSTVNEQTCKQLETQYGSLENALNSIGFSFKDEKNYWKISPGSEGEDWENQLKNGVIGIHFFDFGDLSALTEDELRNKIREAYGNDLTPAKQANTFGQMRDFMKIKEGDIILANKGKSKILGIGRVVGPYKYRQEMRHPHTFPVEWYDTTEGTIPKQEGWMITVIQLSKEEFEKLTALRINYLLLRHSATKENKWKDEIGKQYHFGRIPNYTKLVPGAKTIWYDRDGGDFYYWGYGDISKIEKESDDHLHAYFDNFRFFNQPTKENPTTEDITPKKGLDSTKEKIMNLPGWNNQISMLEITKDIYDEIIRGEEKSETFDDDKLSLLTPDEIKQGYAKISDELLIPEEKITEIVTALASGRHVLLAGPIGTGKTRLAKIIPEVFWEKAGGYYSEDHTATADWSTQDVIGGIFPKMEDGKPIYDIQNGCVVDTVRKNWENDINGGKRSPLKNPIKNPPYRGNWLIIDEFNRADIDKAFGQLFTALRTRWLKIPTDKKGLSYKNLKIPEDYRIIGTLNTADKHFLFQLSDALKSRFAYIEIDIPKKEEWEQEIYYALKNALDELGFDGFHKITFDDDNKKIIKEKSDSEFYNRILQGYHFLDTVRVFKKLGTAILKLIYQNLIVGTIMTENSKMSLDNALTSNLIPQLENLSVTFIGAIHAMHSDTLISYLKEAYKSPNRQSHVESFEKILDYLEIPNKTRLASDFANGNIKLENEEFWRPLQNAYDNKKKYFEIELNQIKQSMNDLIRSMVV